MAHPVRAWDGIDVASAEALLAGTVVRTPLVRAPSVLTGSSCEVYLKLENLQHAGSFKVRGATNKLASLGPEERKRGVVTASSGNYAQGVAWASRALGVPATVVMAEHASPLKVRATEALGATVLRHGSDYDDAFDHAVSLARGRNLTLVHPYDDPLVVAGQATVGTEILSDLPTVSRVIAGVGGGGLLAGIASALRQRGSDAEVVGVQPSGASTLAPSLTVGHLVVGPRPSTFADGIATRHLGKLPYRILKEARARAVVVDDRLLALSVFRLMEHAKVLAEGAGAAPLAAVLNRPELLENGPVVLVVSGGNLDPLVLERIVRLGLIGDVRVYRVRATLDDLPGRLAEFFGVAAELRANVREVLHIPDRAGSTFGKAVVEVEFDVRDAEHARALLAHYRERGWSVDPIPLREEPVTSPAS